jgi:hypothetical protein
MTGPAAQATHDVELPESWKPQAPAEAPIVAIPDRETDTPEELAAWFSGYSMFEMYRKVLLANCRELVRARFAVNGEKITEARLDDLGRLEPAYLNYLERGLHGRILWEAEYLKRGIGG